MKLNHTSIKGFLFLGLSLLILSSINGCGCVGFSSLYGERVVKRVISPEKDMIAVVYEGGAGATGANSSSVNIFEKSEEIATFSDNSIQKGRVFIIKENPEINLNWKSFNELEIEYLSPMEWEIIEHKNHYLGVTISLKHVEIIEKKRVPTMNELLK